MTIGLKGIIGAGFVLISAPLLLIALSSLGKVAWFTATGQVTTGLVYASEAKGSGRGMGSVPVARFVDSAGKARTVAGTIGRGKSLSGRKRLTHAIGSTVRIAYPLGEPDRAVFADGKTVAWMLFTVLFVSVFPALGAWLIRSDRRELREQGMLD